MENMKKSKWHKPGHHAAAPVNEGRCAQEVSRAQFPSLDWVWGFGAIAKLYLAEHGAA